MIDDAPNVGPWTCFHCGETFTTIGGARNHFGATPDAQPGCLIRVQLGDERGLQMALRKAEAEIASLRAANEQLDHEARRANAMEMEIGRLFKHGARSVQDAFNLFDSMEGRALAAEERANRYEEREAACCPEDVGFEEYIAALTRRVEAAERG